MPKSEPEGRPAVSEPEGGDAAPLSETTISSKGYAALGSIGGEPVIERLYKRRRDETRDIPSQAATVGTRCQRRPTLPAVRLRDADAPYDHGPFRPARGQALGQQIK